MNDLHIIYLNPKDLTPYDNNARKHSKKDISAIAKSIKEFGFSDPIGIYGEKNIIVEGHGRQQAAIQLGLESVPCVRLDHMTEEQRKAYTLAHNKIAELSTWDFAKLDVELADVALNGFNMDDFGFDTSFDLTDDNPYNMDVTTPQYEPTGKNVSLHECVDINKYEQLLHDIDASTVSDDEKQFLRLAAARHLCFNYRNIAEYYCNANAEMQQLMEASALVIIDINDAIKYGYVKITQKLQELANKGG